jgi:hypothetical protein
MSDDVRTRAVFACLGFAVLPPPPFSEDSLFSGDDDPFELDLSGGEGLDDDDSASGRNARFFHVLFLLYRRVFSNRFLRLCSDITCDRMRFSVSCLEPLFTV